MLILNHKFPLSLMHMYTRHGQVLSDYPRAVWTFGSQLVEMGFCRTRMRDPCTAIHLSRRRYRQHCGAASGNRITKRTTANKVFEYLVDGALSSVINATGFKRCHVASILLGCRTWILRFGTKSSRHSVTDCAIACRYGRNLDTGRKG